MTRDRVSAVEPISGGADLSARGAPRRRRGALVLTLAVLCVLAALGVFYLSDTTGNPEVTPWPPVFGELRAWGGEAPTPELRGHRTGWPSWNDIRGFVKMGKSDYVLARTNAFLRGVRSITGDRAWPDTEVRSECEQYFGLSWRVLAGLDESLRLLSSKGRPGKDEVRQWDEVVGSASRECVGLRRDFMRNVMGHMRNFVLPGQVLLDVSASLRFDE